jgi:dienelactone hydrolase
MTRCTIRFFRVTPGIGIAPLETEVRHHGDRMFARIEALVPFASYTVRLARRFRGEAYASFIETNADADGVIDTRGARPTCGTYSNADPDGLFWSMRRTDRNAVPGELEGLVCSVEQDGNVLETRVVNAESVRRRIRVQKLDGEDGLVGTLYLPDSSAARPAIMSLGGSNGGIDGAAEYAAGLANQGFVALALAYFGAPCLPPGLVDIPIEYFERAIRFLEGHPAVMSERLAVLGRSRGGELALLLGSSFPEIKAVVAHVPSPYRWCGTNGPASAAWRYRGATLPYLVPSGDMGVEQIADGRVVYSTTPVFLSALQNIEEDVLESASSEIESTRGPILLLSADDDHVWPSARLAERAMKRLSRRSARVGDEWISYPASGHCATLLPGDPTTEPAFHHPLGQIWLKHGGTPEGNAHAQRDAWDKVVGFLRRNLV